jgi:hypothetical protein
VVPLRSIQAHLGDRRYSSYTFLTSALEGGEWSASRPGRALPPGKELPVPIVQEAGWAPEAVWTQRLIYLYIYVLKLFSRTFSSLRYFYQYFIDTHLNKMRNYNRFSLNILSYNHQL